MWSLAVWNLLGFIVLVLVRALFEVSYPAFLPSLRFTEFLDAGLNSEALLDVKPLLIGLFRDFMVRSG